MFKHFKFYKNRAPNPRQTHAGRTLPTADARFIYVAFLQHCNIKWTYVEFGDLAPEQDHEFRRAFSVRRSFLT